MLPSNGWEEKHGAEWSAAMFRKLAGSATSTSYSCDAITPIRSSSYRGWCGRGC
jgi:hypothetical protein